MELQKCIFTCWLSPFPEIKISINQILWYVGQNLLACRFLTLITWRDSTDYYVLLFASINFSSQNPCILFIYSPFSSLSRFSMILSENLNVSRPLWLVGFHNSTTWCMVQIQSYPHKLWQNIKIYVHLLLVKSHSLKKPHVLPLFVIDYHFIID